MKPYTIGGMLCNISQDLLPRSLVREKGVEHKTTITKYRNIITRVSRKYYV